MGKKERGGEVLSVLVLEMGKWGEREETKKGGAWFGLVSELGNGQWLLLLRGIGTDYLFIDFDQDCWLQTITKNKIK